MAKAEKTKIERVITEEGVVLQLTMQEARVLFSALWRVGGSPAESPRGVVDGIRHALSEGVTGSKDPKNWAYPELACFEGGAGIIAKRYEESKEPEGGWPGW